MPTRHTLRCDIVCVVTTGHDVTSSSSRNVASVAPRHGAAESAGCSDRRARRLPCMPPHYVARVSWRARCTSDTLHQPSLPRHACGAMSVTVRLASLVRTRCVDSAAPARHAIGAYPGASADSEADADARVILIPADAVLQDRAAPSRGLRRCHIFTGTGLTHCRTCIGTVPHLHRDSHPLSHLGATSTPGLCSPAATSAPGLCSPAATPARLPWIVWLLRSQA